MSTQIQLRRGTAAQWTSSNPTLASGEVGYETDTGYSKTGDGATAWVSLAYSNKPNVLTTKGDIETFSTLVIRLGVGANGTILTAASGQATGLAWGSGPLTTKGDIFAYDTTGDRLPVGADGLALFADSNQSIGLGYKSASQFLVQNGVPFILPSSGSMANNGALTVTTSLVNIFPHAYVWMPANAISSGSAAGWYYATFSSATVGTVFNNTYTSGTPTIPGSPTPFVTTGPGSYTQTTGSAITAHSLTVKGGLLGQNGRLRYTWNSQYNNSAGLKTQSATYGGTTFATVTPSTSTSLLYIKDIWNNGTGNQTTTALATTGFGAQSVAQLLGSVDTTSDQTFTTQLQIATATDFIVLFGFALEAIPSH